MAQGQSSGLRIQFEVSLVPVEQAKGGAALEPGTTPVYAAGAGGGPGRDLAKVSIGGRDFNLVLGKTVLVGGSLTP